jgi:uncharacterized protein YbjT (DUF2867 family)
MRIIVVGASSGTGRQVVEQGIARGHEVVAVSRRGTSFAGATNVSGDATEAAVVESAVGPGADAVVLAIGGAAGTDTNRTAVTKAVLSALPAAEVGRIVVHSSLGVGDSMRFLPLPAQLFTKSVLKKAIADHAGQEELVRSSGLGWTIVRPGGLTDKPATGHTVALEEPAKFATVIPRADVAAFILDVVESPDTLGRTYALGTPA